MSTKRKSFTYEGKRYYVRYNTEEEFIMKKAKKIVELENDLVVVSSKTTVNQWLNGWVDIYKKDVGLKTQKHYETLLNRFADIYGTFPIKSVKQRDIQLYLNNLEGSQVTLDKNKNALSQFFNSARINGLITQNPVEDVTVTSKVEAKKRRPLTHKEINQILSLDYHPFFDYIFIMFNTGLRTMEVAALQVKDINFDKGVVSVTKTVKNGNVIGNPKSKSGIREVPLTDDLIPTLKRLCDGKDPFEYLLIYEGTNDRYSQNSVSNSWKSFKECLLLEYPNFDESIVMYCLRHTYCTNLQDAGVPINVAREIMGHSSINITSRIYTHHSDKCIDNAREMLNKTNNVLQFKKVQ